ncbi:MAG: cytochrome c maturation protein CcmE [Candidatus Pelagibacter sp. TMED118]|nr:MAG: cytochrome c maturation protein CcmE [Candidatus Pelagibacter sp. TMED118]|tara:strand:- start:4598 stop:5020 length:423 start_codon:yes stop_codon:yes gene_type:complete
MIGKKVKLRITFLFLAFLSLILIIFLIIKSLEDNVVYFKSPTEIKNLTEIVKRKVRVGGMVKKDSLEVNAKEINFIITDFKNEINVTYSGIIPNLFEEEKGVVAEGFLQDKKFFVAKRILAKHDENYMPPEVKKALENNK